MPRVRKQSSYGLLCLACAAGAILPAIPAAGQETGLRGAVSESEITSTLLPTGETDARTTGTVGFPANAYQPVSPGALPEADPDQDPLSPPAANTPSRRPSTAIGREREREEAAQNAAATTGAEEAGAEGSVDEIDTASLRAASAEPDREDLFLPLRANERVRPVGNAAERRPETDPYAPLGLRLGTFTLFPTLEEGLTWTSNADNSPDGREALLSESTLRLNAVSDWSRHRAVLDGFATYRKSLSGEEVSELEGAADAALELDLAHGMTGRAALGYSARRESASSPVAIAGVDRQPLRHTIDGAVGLEKALGRIHVGITGEVSRDQYGDARLTDGTTLSQAERDSTLALARLRGGYELSPALMPFIEIEAGRRFYDEERDSAGYARSANRYGVRGGIELDLSEKLAGEVSAGWIAEDFEDDRLETISGLALAAALDWSPMRGTNVRLNGTTTIEGSADAGDSGSLLYTGRLSVERRLRSNLTGNLALGAAWRDYEAGGHDLVLNGEATLTWWLNRYAGLTGRLRHERQTSDLPGRDYETTSVFMGMKLQR
ncbi:outer membrane beta-barrel protein [Nitratireductor sp. GCM10026969]|uniref:outer membrane beta-barrel protein n=1 Tax=Nitratireductor sp. GCM10026969 TaxID=3252645 RepID=UPI00361BD9EA